MSMEFVNMICPNCKNPDYVVSLGDFSKVYKYKCMNCCRYFSDIDFEKEPIQSVWKNKYMNLKKDMVGVVRCKNCKHYDEERGTCAKNHAHGNAETWFCADGKEKE